MNQPYNNPLGLKIGQVVTVKRICFVSYIENKKQIVFEDFNAKCIVIGTKKKATGTYQKGHQYLDFLGDEDYEPACLVVDKYHWFYECKTQIHLPSFLVLPGDIQ